MAIQLQLRRGSTSDNNNFTGAVGEITMDTTTHELRTHDGSTQGGHIVGETSKQVANKNASSAITNIKPWLGTDTQYTDQNIETTHADYVCLVTDEEPEDIQEAEIITFPARNVGDIFLTKRLDARLNGAVECNGSIYHLSDYQGSDSIYNLFLSNKLQYISMSAYTADILAKGWCDKFGWDGEGNDEFKVPTLTAKIIQENNISVIGDGKSLGLTNGTTNYGIGGISVAGVTATQSAPSFYNTTPGDTSGGGAHSTGALGLTQTTGESGIIINLSDSSVDLRVMVQLATGYVDDALESIPTVNDATITITQGGVTKGSFTTNQSSASTIALDAGGGDGYHPDLFDVKWTDHQLDDVQWLRADTFSWQSGAVYQVAYQHLADDIDGKTLQSETIGSTTIQFYLADDGHKICPDTEESNVTAIYNATGVAWYYIIDTVNERFKLPRINPEVVKKKDLPSTLSVGGNGSVIAVTAENADRSIFVDRANSGGLRVTPNVVANAYVYDIKNLIARVPSLTTHYAGCKYLYFYVGNFTQTALENTAGLNVEMFNDLNAHKVIEFQAPTADNDYTWYRKYADGWVEQGGRRSVTGYSTASDATITLPVEMADLSFSAQATILGAGENIGIGQEIAILSSTQISLRINYSGSITRTMSWEVKGMTA